MTFAYSSLLKERAADDLGRMLDFAVYSLRLDADSMMELFVSSNAAALFERGSIRLICGMSGPELAYAVLDQSGLPYDRVTPRHTASLSSEYWCGYALAAAQHSLCLSFGELMRRFRPSALVSLYSKRRLALLDSLPPDVTDEARRAALMRLGEDFVSRLCSQASSADDSSAPSSVLKKMRTINGLSQSQLAGAADIPVRTIQQYEQGQKDLRKARSESLLALSRALHCRPEDLIS